MRNTTQYVVPGTKTLRLGSRALWKCPPFKGYGTNLQNIEKKLRSKYVPDGDNVFVQTDQAGAEALIVAYEMPPANKLRQLFDNKVKPHTYFGVFFPQHWAAEFPYVTEFAEMPIPELKTNAKWIELAKAIAASDNNPPQRRYYYLYKQTVHSANYDVRSNTFIENILLKSGGVIRLTKPDGELYLNKYHTMIPELRSDFHRSIINEYRTTGAIRNLFGFPLTITGVIRESDYQELYAKKPQSTVGTITNIAYTLMQDYIEARGLKWDMLANTHDSYLTQCPPDEVMHCAVVQKRFMEQELTNSRGEHYFMRSETSAGYNWAPASAKNPNGLKEISQKDLANYDKP